VTFFTSEKATVNFRNKVAGVGTRAPKR
jgi:hypothetical protein